MTRRAANTSATQVADSLTQDLAELDPEIAGFLNQELERQQRGLEMIASENHTPMAVMQAQGSVLTNKYAEGYPGRRYYGGASTPIRWNAWQLNASKTSSAPSTRTSNPTPEHKPMQRSCTRSFVRVTRLWA